VLAEIRRTVSRIPKGRVATYGEIARLSGYPGAARQAAWALSNSHGLPWHRVVGAQGKILLRGDSAAEQKLRLAAEGIRCRNGRVDLEAHCWAARGAR